MRKLAALVACASLLAATPVTKMLRPVPGGKPWTRAQVVHLQHQLSTLLHAPTLRGAQIGFLAIDTQRGTLLYSRNPNEEFMPASNMKLIVGSTAVQDLGVDFSYITAVFAEAQPVDGVEDGNIYLRGGGDALLSAADLDNAAAAVVAAGIKRVTGWVVTDASHDDDQRLGYGWSWDDLPYYYAPVVTALELEDGVVHIHIVPGEDVGDACSLEVSPESTAYTIDNELTTGRRGSQDTSDITRVWDQPRTIVLFGSYPLGAKRSGDLRASVPDPESYAGDVFLRALSAHGVEVTGGVRRGKVPQHPILVWTHHSLVMPKLMQRFWYPSDNLMAELLLKELGVMKFGEPGTTEHGAVVERDFLRSIGVDPNTVTIGDGSGLSQYDRITPHDFIKILMYDWKSKNHNLIIDALPLVGVRGTQGHHFKGTAAVGHVWAKDGVISHVRTLSGFIQTRTHGVVTFSLLINQWMGAEQPGGPAALERLRGAILSAVVRQ
jgi:D-alanyl-D-alanine carboxypeptidase/D-alanyl-D-alanine-endopeptidase (penicillin-binding protein 4)